MKIVLFLILTAAIAFADVKTVISVEGVVLPSQILGAGWGRLTNYGANENDAGLGVGIGYRGNEVKVDLYVYETLKPEWAQLPLKDRIQNELDRVPEIFNLMVKQGDYSDVKIKKPDVVRSGLIEFQHVEIDYIEKKSGALNSHYFLSSVNGKVFKVRISRLVSSNPLLVMRALTEITDGIPKK